MSGGNLNHESTQISSGTDKFGAFVQIYQEWNFQNQIFSTSVESYENMAIFTQHYPTGLQNVSLGNHFIRTYFKRAPASALRDIQIDFYASLSDLMSRPRCGAQPGPGHHGLAQPGGHRPGPLLPLIRRLHGGLGRLLCGPVHREHHNHQVTSGLVYNVILCVDRDGEYGGPLLLFNHNLSHCVLLSPLNNFMVSSLYHNREEASLQWGLMGSVQVRVKHQMVLAAFLTIPVRISRLVRASAML